MNGNASSSSLTLVSLVVDTGVVDDPLPCVRPPGEEANVIFDLAANDALFAVELGFELTAEALIQAGTADPIFADAFQE